MTSILRGLTIVAIVACFGLDVSAEDGKTTVNAAVQVKAAPATKAQLAAWPGYIGYYDNYGIYYGSSRWRYQPSYTYYNWPSFGYGYGYSSYYTPYAYGWPPYNYGYGYGAPYYTWPHYGAYGYTYYGPVAY